MSQDRRNFLKSVGTGAAAAVAVSKIAESPAAAAATTADNFEVISPGTNFRANNQIKLALELDGQFAGWLSSFEGGQASGEVVEHKDESGVVRKHLGNVKYNDISITSGAEMSKGFFEWIKATLNKDYARKDGAIVAADFDYNTQAVMQFSNALVTEIGFPALDAASKDAAKMTLKFKPEVTRYKHQSGRVIGNESKAEQKMFTPSNFRLTIDGLDQTTAKVSKVEAITIKQTAVSDDVGDQRDYTQEPAKIDFPNLKITMAEVYADGFSQWHEDFVIKGNNGADKEKSGTLEYLDATRQKVLLSLEFKGLGIFKFEPNKISNEEHKRSLPEVDVQLYCNDMQFKFSPK
jgi:phage tail-like protein